MIRLLFCVLCWVVLSVPAALFGFPALYFTGRVDLLWKLSVWAATTGRKLAGIRVEAVDAQRIQPGQAYLFMANHVSNLDPPIITPLLGQRISIIAKRELFRIPLFGRAMRAANFVCVNRSDRKGAVESVRDAVNVLRSGLGMMVFPEGTRSPNGRLLPFKKGPFHLAMEAGVPVLPITIVGSYEAWPKGRFSMRPGVVRVYFHEPIEPAAFQSREELMAAVRTVIESALPAQYRAAADTNIAATDVPPAR